MMMEPKRRGGRWGRGMKMEGRRKQLQGGAKWKQPGPMTGAGARHWFSNQGGVVWAK